MWSAGRTLHGPGLWSLSNSSIRRCLLPGLSSPHRGRDERRLWTLQQSQFQLFFTWRSTRRLETYGCCGWGTNYTYPCLVVTAHCCRAGSRAAQVISTSQIELKSLSTSRRRQRNCCRYGIISAPVDIGYLMLDLVSRLLFGSWKRAKVSKAGALRSDGI